VILFWRAALGNQGVNVDLGTKAGLSVLLVRLEEELRAVGSRKRLGALASPTVVSVEAHPTGHQYS